jgi:catechol 2,3-dioxygenase-like lactoylglutathione lyase family enzyme
MLSLAACDGCRSGSGSPHRADAASTQPATSATLLGGERGLDHVGIAVRDLAAATRTFRDVLGFNRPTEGTLPNGIHNMNYYFGDSTYLETMVAWDRGKAPWLASFTDSHEGAMFAVLAAFSPESTRAFLGRRGIAVGDPYSGTIRTEGEDAMPAEKWRTFFLPKGLLLGDPLYFIAYERKDRDEFLHKLEVPRIRRAFHHKNTALGLRAVWIAVRDLAEATRAYESIGLVKEAPFADAPLDANGQSFGAGAGEIRLLAPRSPTGPLATFLNDRGAGAIVGMTLVVGSVATAAAGIGERAHVTLEPAPALVGSAVRLPPEITHGVWMEMTQL